MGEAVAIVSVSASALVGVGGLAAAAWSGSRQRRWQSREERTVNLRAVLDQGSEALLELAWIILDMRTKVERGDPVTATDKQELEELIKRAAVPVQANIKVRRGPHAPETVAFSAWIKQMSKLIGLLGNAQSQGFEGEAGAAWEARWAAATEAESAYHTAAAAYLTA
jgi:hypothetical protein